MEVGVVTVDGLFNKGRRREEKESLWRVCQTMGAREFRT